MTQGQARLQFADWLKTNYPDIFQRAITIAENSTNTTNGLGAHGEAVTSNGSFWDKFSKAAMGLGTTVLTLKNQRDAMKINLKRAQNGQPPIDMATSAPVIRTQVDMSPELTQRLVSNIGAGLKMPLLLAGAGLAAFFLLRKGR